MAVLEVQKSNDAIINYVFSTCTSEAGELNAEITDQYVEDNTTIQDHMGIKPLKFTLTGFVAEKVYYRENIVSEDIETFRVLDGEKTALNVGLGIFRTATALIPKMSNYVEAAYQFGRAIEDNVKKYSRVLKMGKKGIDSYRKYKNVKKAVTDALFSDKSTTLSTESANPTPPTREKNIFNYLQTVMENRLFVAVQNDYGYFENCLIESVRMEQSNMKYCSNLTVTVKQIRLVESKLTNINKNKFAGRTESQAGEMTDIGLIAVEEKPNEIN